MDSGKHRINSTGVRWIVDEKNRPVGYMDTDKREYMLPATLDEDGIDKDQDLPQSSVSGGVAGTVSSADYYLDGIDGSDTNDGLTPATALRTATAASALDLAGKTLAVRSGSVFRDTLTIVGAGAVVRAYGFGDKPLFDASEQITDGWTLTSGQTEVWERQISLPGNTKAMGNVWLGDEFLTQVTSVALVASTAKSCYVSDWSATSATLYIRSAADPNGGDWSYSARLYGVFSDASGVSLYGIRARRQAHQDGSIVLTGENCYTEDTEAIDGCRHNQYCGPGWVGVRNRFYRAKNDLEAGGAAMMVCHNATVNGKQFATRNCTFDAGGLALVSGIIGHGDTGQTYASYTSEDDRFIGLASCIDVASYKITASRPVPIGCTKFIGMGVSGGVARVTGAPSGTSLTTRVAEFTASGSLIDADNDWEITYLTDGAYRSYSAAVSANVQVSSRINVVAGDSAGYLVNVANGSVHINRSHITPVVACPVLVLVRAGFNGATCRVKTSNNTLPMGAAYEINSVATTGLAALQAAGYEVGSSVSVLGPMYNSTFDVSDANLESVSGWALSGTSTAAQAGVRTNALAFIGTTKSAYSRGAMPVAAQWAAADVSAVYSGGPFPLAVRMSDENNWIGARWTSGGYAQVYKSVAGSISQISQSNTIAPAVGQRMTLAVRNDRCWLYIDDIAVVSAKWMTATTVTGLATGVVANSQLQNPCVDNWSSGIA